MKLLQNMMFLALALFGVQSMQAADQSAQLVNNFVFANGFWGPKCKADVDYVLTGYKQAGLFSEQVAYPLFEDVRTSRPWNTFLGQGQDARDLLDVCTKQVKPYVLYGCSRGGYAIYNILTNSSMLGELAQKAPRAIILEAAPSDILDTTHKALVENIVGCSISRNVLAGLAAFLTQDKYSYGHIPPALVKTENVTIPDSLKQVPILLLHSQTDLLVQHHHSCVMYKKLKELGFTNVSFYSLPYGAHTRQVSNKKVVQQQTFETPQALGVLNKFYTDNNINIQNNSPLSNAKIPEIVRRKLDDFQKEVAQPQQDYNRKAKKATLTRVCTLAMLGLCAPYTVTCTAAVCFAGLALKNHFKRLRAQSVPFRKIEDKKIK